MLPISLLPLRTKAAESTQLVFRKTNLTRSAGTQTPSSFMLLSRFYLKEGRPYQNIKKASSLLVKSLNTWLHLMIFWASPVPWSVALGIVLVLGIKSSHAKLCVKDLVRRQ